jgi:NAD(P)-dependent dehydrogenase (short-subunit alcohol dehydrogenase family)
MSNNHLVPEHPRPQFPFHNESRVWLITAGDSPIGISVTRQILMHGDYVLVGLAHTRLERDQCRQSEFETFLAEIESHSGEGWRQRFKSVPFDIRWDFHK